jgi:mono/diheme cytochrome c family protein
MKSIRWQRVFFAFFLLCVFGWLVGGDLSGEKSEASQAAGVAPDGAALFKQHCSKCHGSDGHAKTFRGRLTGARNLTNADWQAKTSDEHIFNVISTGRGKMPSFGKKLSEEEMNSLVAFVRGLKK